VNRKMNASPEPIASSGTWDVSIRRMFVRPYSEAIGRFAPPGIDLRAQRRAGLTSFFGRADLRGDIRDAWRAGCRERHFNP